MGERPGQFPVDLLQSIKPLSIASRQLTDKAIKGFKVNLDQLTKVLVYDTVLVTVLNPIVEYLKVAEIAKCAHAEGRTVTEVAQEGAELNREELERLLDPMVFTQDGI